MLNKTTIVFFFFADLAKADITVSGTIQDSKSGKPIALVNILDEESGAGTVSDESGKFILSASEQTQMEITFKHIAYGRHYQVFSSSDTGVVVPMTETLLQMNDVVVTSTRSGYLLREVPIATEVIGTKEINESGATTVSELRAQRAGV